MNDGNAREKSPQTISLADEAIALVAEDHARWLAANAT
jgi:hypothetical protein